jgi:hypothetical protein
MAKKQRYTIRNWSDYNKALVKRGSITLWFDEKSVRKWHKTRKEGRGRPKIYADAAILCMLTIKMVFRLPLRATQGLVKSMIELLGLSIEAADYTTLCRRQKQLKVPLRKKQTSEPLHAVFDSTGLKVFGEGEWKVRQHGYSKRRTWRKLHLGIDEATGEVVAEVLSGNDKKDGELLPNLIEQIKRPITQVSGDGAYDSFEIYDMLRKRGIKATIPPREDAKIKLHGNTNGATIARDDIVRDVRNLGRSGWKQQNGYHRRSLAETAMFRFKKILGNNLHAILFETQMVEAAIKCNILNKMTVIGMPISCVVK